MRHGLQPTDFQSNRRSEARTPVARRLDIMPCASTASGGRTTSLRAELTDCSPGGLGLLAPRPLLPGAQFLVKLKVGGQIKLLVYTVEHCCQAETDRHRIGAHFSGLATEDAPNDPATIMAALLATK